MFRWHSYTVRMFARDWSEIRYNGKLYRIFTFFSVRRKLSEIGSRAWLKPPHQWFSIGGNFTRIVIETYDPHISLSNWRESQAIFHILRLAYGLYGCLARIWACSQSISFISNSFGRFYSIFRYFEWFFPEMSGKTFAHLSCTTSSYVCCSVGFVCHKQVYHATVYCKTVTSLCRIFRIVGRTVTTNTSWMSKYMTFPWE